METDEKFRHYLTAIVEGTPGLAMAAACATGKEALARFEHRPPEVMVAGLFLGDMSGTDLVWQARQRWPGMASLLLISEEHHRHYFEVLEAGASGCLSKPCLAEELVRAIWAVSQGGAVLCPSLAKAVTDYFRARGAVVRQLTHRQRQVLQCLARGLSEQKAALELGVSRATIQAHARSLRAKLNAHSVTEIVSAYFNPKDLRGQKIPAPAKSGGPTWSFKWP